MKRKPRRLPLKLVLALTIICGAISLLLLLSASLYASSNEGELIRSAFLQTEEKVLENVDSFPIHLISIGTYPLPVIALATLDSIARHMDGLPVYFHFTIEENISSSVLQSRKEILMNQIQFFQSHGMNLTAIYHSDFSSYIQDTPLERLPFKQRHFGGMYNTFANNQFPAHASDVLRALLLFKHGGMYNDYDQIILKDFRPLLRRYGPACFTSNEFNQHMEHGKPLLLNNGWLVAPPRHPILNGYLSAILHVMNVKGVNCPLSWKFPHGLLTCSWEEVGPTALKKTHEHWCDSHPDYLPLLVNQINLTQPIHEKKFPYTILAREYTMPVHWSQSNFYSLSKAASMHADTAETYASRIIALSEAYAVHVFNPNKKRWLQMLQQPELFPLSHFVLQQSCKYLCDPLQFTKLLP